MVCINYINSNLALSLIYNEDTDYFGITYNGKWNNVLFAGLQLYYLYENGNEFTEKTGGFSADGYSIHSAIPTNGSVTKNDSNISLTVANISLNGRAGIIIGTANMVNLSKYSKLCAIYNWGGIEKSIEVDISSLSSGYVLLYLDHNYYNEGHVINFFLSCSTSKNRAEENRLNANYESQNYDSKYLTVNIEKVWLE